MVQSLEPSLAGYTLADRYDRREGRVFLTGIQALARLPLEQLRLDRAAGLSTAAFVSGYPGSPLGGFDQEVARAARQAPDLPIVCQPAVNEELGATAVMGSQLAAEQQAMVPARKPCSIVPVSKRGKVAQMLER